MAIDVKLTILDRDADSAKERAKEFVRRSYTHRFSQTLTLSAGVKTEVKHNMTTVTFVYVEVVNASDDAPGTVYVYKNLSPESWTVQHLFLCCDTSISQLALMSTAGATVYVYLGGE
jgi:hypothetical protein